MLPGEKIIQKKKGSLKITKNCLLAKIMMCLIENSNQGSENGINTDEKTH